MRAAYVGVMGLAMLVWGCSDGDTSGRGRVRVLLSAEETITNGLDTGSDPENTEDYPVRYTKYLATVGNLVLRRGAAGEARIAGPFVVDMTEVGEAGIELGVLSDLAAGEWPEFGFETPAAAAGATALGSVSEGDLATMTELGITYWIEGVVERSAAEGGPVEFVVQAAVPTLYTDCEYDGEPGVSVVASGTAAATVTLHGDHMFFNAFPTGSEGAIVRRAGWLVEADLDGNGKVEVAELAQADATDLFTRAKGYSLDGAPIPVETALDFVRAQLATQGHYKGEGECIWEFEGVRGE
jgi:hypothetical protein